MNLSTWAQTAICVDQDGESTARVRLVINEDTMGSWAAEGFDPQSAENYLSELLDSLPARSQEGCWIAESASGVARCQLPITVTGRSRASLNARESQAELQVRATHRLLEAAQSTAVHQQATIELLLQQNRVLMAQVTELRPSAGAVLAESVAEEIAPLIQTLPELVKAVAYYLGQKPPTTTGG